MLTRLAAHLYSPTAPVDGCRPWRNCRVSLTTASQIPPSPRGTLSSQYRRHWRVGLLNQHQPRKPRCDRVVRQFWEWRRRPSDEGGQSAGPQIRLARVRWPRRRELELVGKGIRGQQWLWADLQRCHCGSDGRGNSVSGRAYFSALARLGSAYVALNGTRSVGPKENLIRFIESQGFTVEKSLQYGVIWFRRAN